MADIDNNYFENEIINLSKISSAESTEFINCDFNSLDLSNKSFNYSKFIQCRFKKCNLSNSSLNGARFRDTSFLSCKLLGIDWSDTLSTALLSFSDSMLDLCVFHNLDIRALQAVSCSIKDADFSQCKLQNAHFKNSNLQGSNFNQCDFSNADFKGAEGYFIDPNLNAIKNAKFSMPEAMIFFEALKINVEY